MRFVRAWLAALMAALVMQFGVGALAAATVPGAAAVSVMALLAHAITAVVAGWAYQREGGPAPWPPYLAAVIPVPALFVTLAAMLTLQAGGGPAPVARIAVTAAAAVAAGAATARWWALGPQARGMVHVKPAP